MAQVVLSHGLIALISDEDIDRVCVYEWSVHRVSERLFYAVARIPGSNRRILMHRHILQPPPGMVVAHRTDDGLDNRRTNLRIMKLGDAIAAHRLRQPTGAYLHKGSGKYHALTQVKGKRHSLGLYNDKETALAAVRLARQLLLEGTLDNRAGALRKALRKLLEKGAYESD